MLARALPGLRAKCDSCSSTYFGATVGNRTPDLLFTRELLYQLSYGGMLPRGNQTSLVEHADSTKSLDGTILDWAFWSYR